MAISQQERKTIVPTIILGVGGTGMEVISRVRRMVVESYGSLENLPILGFLHVDTDRDYQVSTPSMAGPPLEAFEKYWSRVKYDDAERIVRSPEDYPWFHQWLPTELISKPGLLASEEGAGQIRACGRFSFFFNHHEIRQKCEEVRRKINGHEQTMTKYGLTVLQKLNIFVVASISGGTGSGMLIDLGYSLRDWFKGENALEITAMVPSPDAFTGIGAGLRIKENGYAALMELNYFTDTSTLYSVLYGPNEISRLEFRRPPYDFTYIIGSNNGHGVTLKLDTVREMMAQNLFLDLVSDYSPYKRSIRDNIKSDIGANNDVPAYGRSYPRNFMSFGIATIEIPIHQIRSSLAARLAAELYKWWLNANVLLPHEMRKEVERELKALKLLGKELRSAILRSSDDDRPYQQIVQLWLKDIADRAVAQNLLECTSQLPRVPPFAQETGKITTLIDDYLAREIQNYREAHFQDSSPDPRAHGDFLLRMYNNRDHLVNTAAAALQEVIGRYLQERNRGPYYLRSMLDQIESAFNAEIERSEREAEKTWKVVESVGMDEYTAACSKINEFRTRWLATKQDWMNQQFNAALAAQGKSLQALLERKSRIIAAQALRQIQEYVTQLKRQLERWLGRVETSAAKFLERANQEADRANAIEFVGLKLFEPQELDELYVDLIESYQGIDRLYQQITEQVLASSNQSRFWRRSPHANSPFGLLNLEKIADVEYPDFEDLVGNIARQFIVNAPPQSKLNLKSDACTRFIELYPEERDQQAQIELLFNRSKSLVRLDRQIPLGRFNYIEFAKAGLVGGQYTEEPAAQRQVKLLQKYFKGADAIAPLSEKERHQILAVHEIGGFSLRCLDGATLLRKSYQKWRGQRIRAERTILKGGTADLPIPVHIQNEIVFWDLTPSDPAVEKLTFIARAFGILRQELNQKTKKDVIRYRKPGALREEVVTLAANWEEAVQVLELPDCRDDRREVQQQLEQLLEKAETDQPKLALRRRLEAYLNELLQTDFRKYGQDDPLYLRQKTIVEEFIIINKLGTELPTLTSEDSSPPRELGFVTTSTPEPSSQNSGKAEYEQYLTQMLSLDLPQEAFQMAAQAKATQLGLSQDVSHSILRQFLA